MAATLKAFILDEATRKYMDCAILLHEDPMVTAEELSFFCDLTEAEITLTNLPDGDYGLIISADIENDTQAQIKLVNLATNETIKESSVDLAPIMESAILYHEDYNQANIAKDPDEELKALESMRSQPLNTLMAPYIADNQNFNTELLELLDLLTQFTIQDKLIEIENSCDSVPDSPLEDPLNKFIPPSNMLH